MAKQKRHKAYRPKVVNREAMNWALSGAYTLPAFKQAELIGYVDAALDALRRGAATRDEWNTLANGMNIAESLAHFQIGPNLMPAIQAAQDALHAVALRISRWAAARATPPSWPQSPRAARCTAPR